MFIIISGIINMFMGSASAKWAIMAPVFIPMFMLLGYSPELSQAVYRIGDSVTNLISPMMSFFALIIVYFEKYDSKSGIGSLCKCDPIQFPSSSYGLVDDWLDSARFTTWP